MPNLPRLVRVCALLAALGPVTYLPGSASADVVESTIDLAPQLAPHDLAQVTVELEVGGVMRVQQDGGRGAETRDLPMSVAATLRYDEHRLAPTTNQHTTRAVRWYHAAEAVIKVDGGGLTPKLSDERRLIAVENPGGRLLITSPRGILQRHELDLIDVIGDSLVLDALLPTRPVADGDTWAADADVMAALLSLDTIANCNVQSTLDKANADFALVRVAGVVIGTADGAATEMDVRGVYLFDRKLRRIMRFNLAVKEVRSIGGATPGLDGVAKLRLTIKPFETSEQLTPDALASLEAPRRVRLDMLRLDMPQQGYRILHDRRWFITSTERETISLRRVVDGDVVAHATISSLPAKTAGRQVTLEEFERDIRYALREKFGELVSSRQWTNAFRHHCLEVVVRGTVEEVPVEWHYYHVAPESGSRVSVVVTIDGQMVQRLGAADRQLINAIQLVPPAERVARRPSEPSEPSEPVERSLVRPQR